MHVSHVSSWLMLLAVVALWAWPGHAVDPPAPISRLAEIRGMSRAELAKNPPVHIRGVVTRSRPSSLFVQDASAGLYINVARARIRGFMSHDVPIPDVPLGSEVEIIGVADPGGYSPIVLPETITILGPGTLPHSWANTTWLAPPKTMDDIRIVCRGVSPAASPNTPNTRPKGATPSCNGNSCLTPDQNSCWRDGCGGRGMVTVQRLKDAAILWGSCLSRGVIEVQHRWRSLNLPACSAMRWDRRDNPSHVHR